MTNASAAARRKMWTNVRRNWPLFLVFGVAAYQSYWHTVEVATANGEATTAYAMAFVTDGMLVAGAKVIMDATKTNAARWAAGVTFVLGVVATFAVNFMAADPTPGGVFMATWPAVGMTATSLVMHLASHRRPTPAQARRKTATKATTATKAGKLHAV